jgi:hypothetical protein
MFLNAFATWIDQVAVQMQMETSELHVDENPKDPLTDERINSNRIYKSSQSNTNPHIRCNIYTNGEKTSRYYIQQSG